MWIISLLFAFTRFVRRIRKELTEPDPSQSKNKEKSIFRKNVCEESWKCKTQWKSVAIDGGSGRRASQEIETVRRKSAQNPEIRVGVAKIFYFFRLSNLFLAKQTSQRLLPVPQFHLLPRLNRRSSIKGHFLCCETKLVTLRKNLSRVASIKCQHIVTLKIKLPLPFKTFISPPEGSSLAQLIDWLKADLCFCSKKEVEQLNHGWSWKRCPWRWPETIRGSPSPGECSSSLPIPCQRHLVRSCSFTLRLQPLNGARESLPSQGD